MKYNYTHKEETHNLTAPRKIVPIINKLINPKSVVDIGCGIGTFLYAFKEMGVSSVLGIDGKWTNRKLLSKYLKNEEFREADLSQFVKLEKEYDLAICLEVAEHIDEKFSDNLVKTLVHSSKVILFSAAIPFQSGQNHMNEQWPGYWAEKFLKHGFYFNDLLRPKIWNEEEVDFWYRQNMFLVTHKSYQFSGSLIKDYKKNSMANVIHPALFEKKAKLLDAIVTGKKNLTFYLILFFKALLVKTHFYQQKKY